MLDLRFSTALQIMLSLALAEDYDVDSVTSAHLAEGLGASASFVRKAVVPLVRDGLIASTMGKHGGLRLGRPARDISLRDIYAIGTGEKRLWSARSDVPARCLVSSNIENFFDRLSLGADDLIAKWLAKQTLADALAIVRELDGGQTSPEFIPGALSRGHGTESHAFTIDLPK
jgi:Rrf2 family transcriptional repressor of oqxAB